MSEAHSASDPGWIAREELERFRRVRRLLDHWSRPVGPPAYYWYLTFEGSPGLHSLARRYQEAISFPYYDLTRASDLHLTLDKIGFEGEISSDRLDTIKAAAITACERIPLFDITIGALGGTPGAIGFSAFPDQPIRRLRDTFRTITQSVCPETRLNRSQFHPHVTIAYCNSDGVPAAEAIAAVEQLNANPHVRVTVKESVLVLLERRPRSYVWRPVSRIPLSG
jgi:2'-5' RNA ligase